MSEAPTGWPGYMRFPTAAKYLDCAESMIRKLVAAGDLSTTLVGADKRIPKASLDAYVARGMAAMPPGTGVDACLAEIRAAPR